MILESYAMWVQMTMITKALHSSHLTRHLLNLSHTPPHCHIDRAPERSRLTTQPKGRRDAFPILAG